MVPEKLKSSTGINSPVSQRFKRGEISRKSGLFSGKNGRFKEKRKRLHDIAAAYFLPTTCLPRPASPAGAHPTLLFRL